MKFKNPFKKDNKKVVVAATAEEKFAHIWASRYLVLKNFVALTFFIIAFFVVYPLSFPDKRGDNVDSERFFLGLFGLFVIVLILGLITEYFVKSIRLQKEDKVKRYTAILSLNTIFGLVIPLAYLNIVLNRVLVQLFGKISHNGSYWCDLRGTVINIYSDLNIYSTIDRTIFWVLLASILMFLIGGFVERLTAK